jgi:multidrug transporter EmrE-like cation transporter
MAAMSPLVIAMIVVSIVAQIVGVALLPRTIGLTDPLNTLLCALCYVVGIGLLARIVHAGVELGIVMPILAAAVPLAAMVLGVVLYGESAAPLKIGLLVSACVAIGVAASLK